MSVPGTVSRYAGDSGNVTSAAFAEVTLANVPSHGLIRRLRVSYKSGVAANVEFELRRSSGGAGFEVLFTGALAASHDRGGPGDHIEVPYIASAFPRAGLADTNLYVALKSNNAGNTVYSVECYIQER